MCAEEINMEFLINLNFGKNSSFCTHGVDVIIGSEDKLVRVNDGESAHDD